MDPTSVLYKQKVTRKQRREPPLPALDRDPRGEECAGGRMKIDGWSWLPQEVPGEPIERISTVADGDRKAADFAGESSDRTELVGSSGRVEKMVRRAVRDQLEDGIGPGDRLRVAAGFRARRARQENHGAQRHWRGGRNRIAVPPECQPALVPCASSSSRSFLTPMRSCAG